MRLSTKSKYIIYIVVLHVVLIGLVYKVLFQDKLIFFACEIFLLISIGISIRLYQNFMEPNQFVKSGIEAIKEKDFTIKFVPTGKGEVDTLIEVYNLMIDELRDERVRLNEKHFFLEKLIAASPIAIIILDFDQKIDSVNEKARTLFEKDNTTLRGKRLSETGMDLLKSMEALPDGASQVLKTDGIETFKVRRSHFMDQGFRRSFLMIEELTSEIHDREKKAYGKVIRMMAHEVNNTLGSTDSILQTTRQYLKEEEELNDALRIASERNNALAVFMRNFADVVRLPSPNRSEIEVNKVVQNVVTFMHAFAASKNIEVKITSMESVKQLADFSQLEQVLVNVIKNAVEACEPGNRVELILNSNQLIIRNNGKPITAEESRQLFNPFYSNKPNGQGIGLTLSREILLNHGFSFSLKTNEEGWTEFTINFPA